ncbi:DUF6660 family protein [Albibacterium bauzanense]|uniref:Uncharacterized protein n=1 Tax=Albibacterium bauzanense TaxID=653929 RepID=A0A4R1LPY1_9SPHI|nr:DUF6660 family protein [Albibacterium bauzanense]TCK80822.1 hypothetical protein C8N28_2576 [Albibacterium bauzanense]
MKLFSIFLAIFFILLDIAPCGDQIDCNLDPGQKTTLVDSGNHPDKPHTEEACTPFCSCACCSISIAGVDASSTLSAYIPKTDLAINLATSFPLSAQFSVWQPPKIA